MSNDEKFFDRVYRKMCAALKIPRPVRGRNALHTFMGAIGTGYGQPLEGTSGEILRLRGEHGLVLDSVYTYKAFVGLRHLIASGAVRRGSPVVFLHSGGLNERFMSVDA